jgi:membrane protease YdiL (CAAX protease family)
MAFTDVRKQKYWQNHILTFIFFLAGTLYIPVTLIRTGVIPFQYRFAVMFCILTVIVSYVWLRKFSWSDLGFRHDTLKRSLMWNLGMSLLFLPLLYLLHHAGLIGKATIHFWPLFFVFYILILTPAQEFFFRSFLFAEMGNFRHRWHWSIVALSSLSFCFLHIIYQNPMMMLVTFFMGLIWSIIYYKYPNFWGVTLSHAMLGTAAFAIGLI